MGSGRCGFYFMATVQEFSRLDHLANLASKLWWKRRRPVRIDGVRMASLTEMERFAFDLGWRESEHCVTAGMDQVSK
jgi:hypothetical protein